MPRTSKPKRLSDRQISKLQGPRPLTPRQLQVLQEAGRGGTNWEAYRRLITTDPSWTATVLPKYSRKPISYSLSFINFKQHLTNAYGRLHVGSLQEAKDLYPGFFN